MTTLTATAPVAPTIPLGRSRRPVQCTIDVIKMLATANMDPTLKHPSEVPRVLIEIGKRAGPPRDPVTRQGLPGGWVAWPDADGISEDTGISRRNVFRALAEARQAGYLNRTRRDHAPRGKPRSNLYHLFVPSLDNVYPEAFNEFMKAYPVGARSRYAGSRRAAWTEWRRLDPDPELQAVILRKVREYASEWKRQGSEGKFLVTPANWLAGARWEDELESGDAR